MRALLKLAKFVLLLLVAYIAVIVVGNRNYVPEASVTSVAVTPAPAALPTWRKRSRGKVVNCSDCASILSTYTNMIGAKLHYAIIGWNFKLNPILGIGAMMFGSPFDSGRLGFSYHAVTTPDATMTIDDATLAALLDEVTDAVLRQKVLYFADAAATADQHVASAEAWVMEAALKRWHLE